MRRTSVASVAQSCSCNSSRASVSCHSPSYVSVSDEGSSVFREAADERRAATKQSSRLFGTSDELIKSKFERLVRQEEEEEHAQLSPSSWRATMEFLGEGSEDGHWINSPCANTLFGSIIALNAISLGLETDLHSVADSQAWLPWFLIESAFLTAFAVELLLRIQAGRCNAFRSLWTVFDAVLLLCGILDTWILEFAISSSGSDLLLFTLLRVVRLVRLVRILRILRLFRFLRELTLLAQGILSAMLALGWSLLLILIVVYISAIFMTEAYEDSEKTASLQKWFGSLGFSGLTLFQLMTLENWHEVVRTVMRQPGWELSWLFFVPFIGLTNIVLLNVVTGVVVERVLTWAASHAVSPAKAEMQQIHTMRELHRLFESVDTTNSGSIDIQQFAACMEDPKVVGELVQLGFLRQELEHLFGYLVAVPEEAVRICDLVDGCLRVRGVAQSKHLLKVQFDALRVGRQSRELLRDLNRQVQWIIRRLGRMQKRRHEEPSRADRKQRRPAATKEVQVLAPAPAAARPFGAVPAPPAQAPPMLDLCGSEADTLESLPSAVPGASSESASNQPEPSGPAVQAAPAQQQGSAAAWLHSRLQDLRSEQAVMGGLLGAFSEEIRELRATVADLRCPSPAKNDAEASLSDSDNSSTSSVIM